MKEAQKRAYLHEEMAADACFDVLSNDAFLSEFCKEKMKTAEGADFIQKIADFFVELAQKLKRIIRDLAHSTDNAIVRELIEDEQMLSEINKRFKELLDSAKVVENSEKTKELSSDIKFMISHDAASNRSYVRVTATDILGEGISETDSLGRKARLYLKRHFKGVVLPLGKTKAAYIRAEAINESTNPAKVISENDYCGKMLL